MKELLILRHAKSSWKDDRLADFERPLNKRGKTDAPRMGQLLLKMDLVPDQIITSAAKRALLTAKSVAASCEYSGDIKATRSLYMASPDDYIAELQGTADSRDRVMIVGHNPGIEDLVEVLVGMWERMPTAALAHVELPIDNWRSMEVDTPARLLNVWRPKELD